MLTPSRTRRSTKIICTIGPSTSSPEMIERLARAGMNCARLNFSHGTLDDHHNSINNVREVSKKLDRHVAIMQDLPGPKIRVGEIRGGSIALKRGQIVQLTSDSQESRGKPQSKEAIIPVHKLNLAPYVEPGAIILLSDGSIELEVIDKNRTSLICRCLNNGILLSEKGINVPKLQKSFRGFTDKDKEFLRFGLRNGVDLVAVSFIRTAREMQTVRDYIVRFTSNPPWVISKIERREAVENASSIIKASDAVMVARGDLGVENPIEHVPVIQKMIISECNSQAIPVITATQMLESMVGNPRPTRAEATDVANAVFDGTDALMLSEETAVGNFPVECVKVLDRVARVAEQWSRNQRVKAVSIERVSNQGAMRNYGIGQATARLCSETNSKLIVCLTASGTLARQIARERPSVEIIAISSESISNKLEIVRDVTPLADERTLFHSSSTRQLRASISDTLLSRDLAKTGEKIVFVSNVLTEKDAIKSRGSPDSVLLLAFSVRKSRARSNN